MGPLLIKPARMMLFYTGADKDISEGAEKSGKVTVYHTEQAGHKIAHFFSSGSATSMAHFPRG